LALHLSLKCYSNYCSKVVQFTNVSAVSRFLSSARSARQTRARPMPDFEQLHEKWGRLMENRKQSAYKPTVVSVTILVIQFSDCFYLLELVHYV